MNSGYLPLAFGVLVIEGGPEGQTLNMRKPLLFDRPHFRLIKSLQLELIFV